jgi:hypothetical protein
LTELASAQVEPGFLGLRRWPSVPGAFREPFDLLQAKVVASQVDSFFLLIQRLGELNSFVLSRARRRPWAIRCQLLSQQPRQSEDSAFHALGTQSDGWQGRNSIRG